MDFPVNPSKVSEPSAPDSEAELTWPPPESAPLALEVMDLLTQRVLSVREASNEIDVSVPAAAAEPQRPAGTPHPMTRVESPAFDSQRFDTGSIDDVARRAQAVDKRRRLGASTLLRVLAAIAVVQAIAIAVFLVRERSSRARVTAEQSAASAIPSRPIAAPPSADDLRPLSPVATSAPARPIASPGRLLVRSDPAGAIVAIDGRRRGTAPLAVEDLAPGSHRVQLGSGGSSIEQIITIEAGSTTSLVVPMQSAAVTGGWLNVAAAIDVQILESGHPLGAAADGPLRLPAGTHQLDLVNQALGYRSQQTVTIRAGEIARLRPSMPDGVLHVNAQPWANVWVDGEQVGETPLANIKVALGQHEIRFRHPSFGEQVRQVVVSASEPARVSVNMKP